jgi:hypothetical protein
VVPPALVEALPPRPLGVDRLRTGHHRAPAGNAVGTVTKNECRRSCAHGFTQPDSHRSATSAGVMQS